MTAEQVAAVLTVVRMEWPHSSLGGGTASEIVSYWHRILGAYEPDVVEDAVKELIASGREHAPGPGLVAKTAAARLVDSPDWDEAWREVLRVMARLGSYVTPGPSDFSHEAIAAFAIPAWAELCSGPAAGTNGYGTHHAQQREAYRAIAARAQRDTALSALGAPRRRAELRPTGETFAAVAARLTEGR